jgi:hypothetical protein
VATAFPEGGRVIIFIFFPRGYPVKFTDPDGRHNETVIVFYWHRDVRINSDQSLGVIYSGSYEAKDMHGNTSRGNFTSDMLPEGDTINFGFLGTTQVLNEELTNITGRIGATITPKHSTRLLRGNLRIQGEKQPKWGFHAHHIVPGQDKRASAIYSRGILAKYGIDPNHAENGVWLSPTEHAKTLSPDYLDRVERLLHDADAIGTRGAVLERLDYIKTNLKNGNFDF